ncbi:MAG: methyltransferase [Reichenbachiella sp.]|uniref:class I SAM-dependent methyltransferase n=1 Tax=Reichenbachiella sp. TaxID=2184521 RepID=UPI00326339F0
MRAYYESVNAYYNEDSASFDKRYWENPILQKIRQQFREEVYRLPFKNILEVGCGTGLDLVHFATNYPECSITGIDVSSEMVRLTQAKLTTGKAQNAVVKTGVIEDLDVLFPEQKYDLIYVFFGALNTVDNLNAVAKALHFHLNENGRLVLTFVNKWYALEVMVGLLKLSPSKAFRRFKKIWGGYSDTKQLDSKCLSPGEVKKIFSQGFDIERSKGFSILYPAWYRTSWLTRFGSRLSELLWKTDQWINRTFLWQFGEYFLYTFKRRP